MYENSFAGQMPQPANNLWVGNNYSSGYSQMSRNNYSPMQQNPQMQNQRQPINNILEVMGPESAQAYQVGPNSRVILMDTNRPVFYFKQSDDSGYSQTKAYSFKEIPLMQEEIIQTQAQDVSDFVTKTEFNEFKQLMEDLVMKNE